MLTRRTLGEGLASRALRAIERALDFCRARRRSAARADVGDGFLVACVLRHALDPGDRCVGGGRPQLRHEVSEKPEQHLLLVHAIVVADVAGHVAAVIADHPCGVTGERAACVFPLGDDAGVQGVAGFRRGDGPDAVAHALGQVRDGRVVELVRAETARRRAERAKAEEVPDALRELVVDHQPPALGDEELGRCVLLRREHFVVRQHGDAAAEEVAVVDGSRVEDAERHVVVAQHEAEVGRRLLDAGLIGGRDVAQDEHERGVGAQLADRQLGVDGRLAPRGQAHAVDLVPACGRPALAEVLGDESERLPARFLDVVRVAVPAIAGVEVQRELPHGLRVGNVDLERDHRVVRQIECDVAVPVATAGLDAEVAGQLHDALASPRAGVGHQHLR